ncbi:aminoglycoside phosphotransferase family protein [Microbacterium sp. CGR1]|uniref:aminoglycoside phosphotransferase family protein n=1 Tax=Microbacterium sp. CGR1 TaxID=1696072 RepID=UPI003DA489C1
MHEGELELSDDAAGRLIARRFPEFALMPLRRVPTAGTVNTIFRIGDDLAARFPLTGETEAALTAEADAMSEFAAVCPVSAPRPVGIGTASSAYPSAWSVQTWVPGETAHHRGHEASESLASDLAGLISSLRATDVRGRVFDRHGRGGVLTDHDEWVALCVEKSGHLLDAARVRTLWDALRSLPSSGSDVMSHRDLTPFNLLVSKDRLVGVLDGGGFGAADPALDLVAAWHLFDAPRREVIRDRLGSGDVEWMRGAAWALQQAMGLGWYYEDSNPAMSDLGLSTMHRLLDDAELSSLG